MDKFLNFESLNKQEPVIKVDQVKTILINCLDNYNQPLKSRMVVHQLITPELSLNRLFEVAKEESMKNQVTSPTKTNVR